MCLFNYHIYTRNMLNTSNQTVIIQNQTSPPHCFAYIVQIPEPLCSPGVMASSFEEQQASLFSAVRTLQPSEAQCFVTFLYAQTLRMKWSGCSSVWKLQTRNGLHFQSFHLTASLPVKQAWDQQSPSADRELPDHVDCSFSGYLKYRCPLAFLLLIHSFPEIFGVYLNMLCFRVAPTYSWQPRDQNLWDLKKSHLNACESGAYLC